jgi:hypothetical protein
MFSEFSFGQKSILTEDNSFRRTFFEKGWVITNNHDTLKGFIFLGYVEVTPEFVRFKNSENSNDEIRFKPEDILEFKFANNIFVSKKLTIDVSPSDYDAIKSNPEQKTSTNTIFLKKQVQGRVSLFVHYGADGRNHYFAQKEADTTIYELTNRMRIKKSSSGGTGLAGDNKYLGILSFLMSDVKDIQTTINKTKFKLSSIEELISDYNVTSTTNDKVYTIRKEGIKLISGIQIGLSSSIYNASVYTFSNSNTPIVGLYLKFQLPRYQRLFFNNELQYISYDTKSYYKLNNYSETAKLKLKNIEYNPSLRFNFFHSKFIPYVNLGLFFVWNFQDNSKLIINNNNIISTRTNLLGVSFNAFSKGVFAGIGIAFKRLDFEIRYSKNKNILEKSNIYYGNKMAFISTQSVNCILSYSFKSY